MERKKVKKKEFKNKKIKGKWKQKLYYKELSRRGLEIKKKQDGIEYNRNIKEKDCP